MHTHTHIYTHIYIQIHTHIYVLIYLNIFLFIHIRFTRRSSPNTVNCPIVLALPFGAILASRSPFDPPSEPCEDVLLTEDMLPLRMREDRTLDRLDDDDLDPGIDGKGTGKPA